jgi:sec-independent protein translocase protein TatC
VVGILEPEQLRGMRKVVYFVMAIVAAVITPGDVITASIALTIPLCLLFELGILLGARTPKREIV